MVRELKRPSDVAPLVRDAHPGRSTLKFNPWLSSTHPLIEAIAESADTRQDRVRRMKDRDRENLTRVRRAVLANVAYAAITHPTATIGVSLAKKRGKGTRYEPKGFTSLPRVLERLSEGGAILRLHKSRRKGVASAIEPGPMFGDEVRREFRPEDFVEAPGRELIILSQRGDDAYGTTTRTLKDYTDTETTERYRAEVKRINACLREANLQFIDDGESLVATGVRSLYRRFNLPRKSAATAECFDLGGRLFGGWWETLAERRRRATRINGEPVADLDFQSMFVRLAYLEAGLRPPNGDLYAIAGGHQRDVVKRMVLAMLSHSKRLTKLPRGLRADLIEANLPIPKAEEIRAAILQAHPALAELFETGVGLRLMFTESQILIAAVLRLIDLGIPALPMHDGLMVAQSREADAFNAMGEASVEVTGFRLPIIRKSLS